MKIKTGTLVLLFSLLFSACSDSSDELTIQDAWARPAQMGENGAVYFFIENDTNTEEILLGASTDIAEAAEAHMSMQNDQGVVSMHQQETIEVPAGSTVAFEPGRLHIMLVSLHRELKVGDVFMLTLRFQTAGETKIQVEVKEQ